MAETIETTAPAATTNKGKGSPDSLPSIATTSITSSEAESDAHMSPRVLFQNSDNDDHMTKEVVENIQTVIENKNSMIEKKRSGISISSSASTEVAAWNLTTDPTKKQIKSLTTRSISNVATVNSSDDEDDEEAVDASAGSFPTSQMRKLTKKGPNATKNSNLISIPSILPSKKPSIIIEDPPADTVTCNRAAMSMTPKQLTEIFNSFDANKTISSMREQLSSQDPTTKDETPSTSPTLNAAETVRSTAARWMDDWIPKNESLEREHQALKEVLEDNSNKMLILREAVETQRALNALKEVEIEDKEKELQAIRAELEDLVHSKELFIQREQELLETIEELSDKLDDLIEKNSRAENQGKPEQMPAVASADLEPFDEPKFPKSFEPEPFDEAEDRASIIRKQDSVIAGLRDTIKYKDKENYLLNERMEQALAKNAILELNKKDRAGELKAKDAEILSLKARLEVALAETVEIAVDSDESHDIDSTETAEDGVSESSSLETSDEIQEATEDDESKEEAQEEPIRDESDESSEKEDLLSDVDQENAPPTPSSSVPPPPAPTGVIADLRKKLESEGEEPQKPIPPREVQGEVSESRRPLEQTGPIRGRSPTPVSECPTEDDKELLTPSPVPPTPQASPVPSEGLRSAIASLSNQIDDVESVSLGSSCGDLSQKASCDISTIVLPNIGDHEDPRRIDFDNEDCPGTIEVMLEGQHYGNLDARRRDVNGSGDDDKDSCCCWSAAVTADLE